MVYEKDKIRRLIEYKDKIINEQIKNDLEWIVGQYNEYYINKKDFNYREETYNKIVKRYYDSEDQKDRIKEELSICKQKYDYIKSKYRQLLVSYKACCKKLKSMI